MADNIKDKEIDMKVKEADVTVTLFNDKKEVFKHANVIFSAANFIRFTTGNQYIAYSGNFKTERELN